MLKQKLTEDFTESLKSGDAKRRLVIGMVLSSVKNRELQKRAKSGNIEELNDDEVLEVIASEVKKRKESIESFKAGGREEMAQSEKEELNRVLPVIKAIKRIDKNIPVSIDTYKSNVALRALKNGAAIVNSLGGFAFDPKLTNVVRKFHCPIIIYHIQGEPKTMQQGDNVYKDLIGEIKKFFKNQIKIGERAGLKKNQFIIDPGIGFGKTFEQNIKIVKELDKFKSFGLPIAFGTSRKSHLGRILMDELKLKKIPPSGKRLEAALAETAIAYVNGARIIRTHDVLETKKFVTTLERVSR